MRRASGGEAAFGDGEREVVVFLLKSERARHAAAAGVQFLHFETRDGAQQAQRGFAADQSFHVAVAVEERPLRQNRLARENRAARVLLFGVQELLEQKAVLGDLARLRAGKQVRVFVAQGQQATGLQAHDGYPALDGLS